VEIVKNVKRTCYVPYHWCYGYYNTLFFERLKEEKVIYGSRCTSCGKCGPHHGRLRPLLCADGEGSRSRQRRRLYRLLHHSIPPLPGQPSTPPYAYGMIKLDGTSNLFMHMIGGVPLEEIKVGMRVKAVWNEERRGDFYDIKYFQPVKD